MATAAIDPDAKREKALEKLKIEIRSILITASRNGASVIDLQRDFEDLNGRPIPLQEFGYRDMNELIRGLPDVISVQRSPDGDLRLYAKSHEATRRIESLIARQKPSRTSRFGGTQQQQQTEEHRQQVAERRRLVEKRLVDICARTQGFISYNDLCRKYRATYYEPFDPKIEFNTQAKTVFAQKLGRLFTVAGRAAGGGFLIRLRDAARTNNQHQQQQPMANGIGGGGAYAAASRPSYNNNGGGGYGYERNNQAWAGAPPPRAVFSTGDGSSVRVTVPNNEYQRQNQENYWPPRGGGPASQVNRPSYNGGRGRGVADVPPRFLPTAPSSKPAPEPPKPILAGAQNSNAPSQPSGSSISFSQRSVLVPPLPTSGVAAAASASNNVGQRPPPLTVTFDNVVRGPSPAPVSASASSNDPAGKYLSANVAYLLSKYPKGVELNVFEDAYVHHFNQGSGVGNEFFRTGRSDLCDVVDVGIGRYFVKPKSSSQSPSTISKEKTLPTPSLYELKEQCKQVLRSHPAGITYLGFPKAYRAIIGRELNLHLFNILSLSELFETMGDVFRVERNGKEILLFEANTSCMIRVENSREVAPIDIAAQDLLVDQLWFVIVKAPEHRLLISQIPDAYQAAFGHSLPVRDWDGFTITLFDYTDRFDFEYEGILKVIAQPSYEPLSASLKNLAVEDNTGRRNVTAGNSTSNVDYVSAGERYAIQTLPMSLGRSSPLVEGGPSRRFEVIVAQIETPARFFVQLKLTADEFEKLLHEMHDYYSVKANAVPIPASDIKIDTPCVCNYEDDQTWCRGLIKDVADNEITISLVDYGTEMIVNADAVYYLPRRFFSLPAQAIQCRLAFLSPPGGEAWPMESGVIMAQVCGSSVLWAELHKLTNGVPNVFLTKSSENNEEIYLNDVLFDANLAVFNEADIQSPDAATGGNFDDLDFEDEIASIGENSETSFRTADEDLQLATTVHVHDVISDGPTGTDLSFEYDVMNQLKNGLLDDGSDLEVVHMARTVLSRKRVALTKKYSGGPDACDAMIVDKLSWLEAQIQWLIQREEQMGGTNTLAG